MRSISVARTSISAVTETIVSTQPRRWWVEQHLGLKELELDDHPQFSLPQQRAFSAITQEEPERNRPQNTPAPSQQVHEYLFCYRVI